jgi:hypothetical protein
MKRALGILLALLLTSAALADGIQNPNAATSGAQATLLPGNPASTASTALVMMGLGTTCVLTPKTTGRINVAFYGNQQNTTISDGSQVKAAFGTGVAPVNGAAASGTTIGTTVSAFSPTANAAYPFFVGGTIIGQALGAALWFDLQAAAITGGASQLANITCVLTEF